MKKILFLILILTDLICFAQNRGPTGYLSIPDKRKAPIAVYDSSAKYHMAKNVVVNRVLVSTPQGERVNGYEIYFFAVHDKKLYRYTKTIVTDSVFDKASFTWFNDTDVRISLDNKKIKYSVGRRDIFLRQPPQPGGEADYYPPPPTYAPKIWINSKIK